MNLSSRVQAVGESATMAVSTLAREIGAEGADVIDLSVGEPDFRTPEPIRQAGMDAIEAGHTTYTSARGLPQLREAIAAKLQADGLDYGPEGIIATPGAKHALYIAMQTLIEADDEVLILDPAWVSYEPMVTLAGGTSVHVDLGKHNFELEPALSELSEAVSPKTQLLLVNSPNNPTGSVYSDAALRGVRDIAVDHDITVLSDEIYQQISYETSPTSLGSLDGMGARTLTVNGMSKAYAMTGWRLGYLAGPVELIDAAVKVQSHSVSCASNFVQRAGVAALLECQSSVDEMRNAFHERRDRLVDLLADAGVDVPRPQGAFYLMVPVDDDDSEWCEQAIREAHVATVPGSAFGASGYARVSYAASSARIEEGVERLIDAGFI